MADLEAVEATVTLTVVVDQSIPDMELQVKDFQVDLGVDLMNRDKTVIGVEQAAEQEVEEQMHLIIIPQQHKK
jgi:hypothetical protein